MLRLKVTKNTANKKLVQFVDTTGARMIALVGLLANKGVGIARVFAPVEFGNLRSEIIEKQVDGTGLRRRIISQRFYSASLEFGQKRYRRGPQKGKIIRFMKPMADKLNEQLPTLMKNAFRL
ncbi:MAG: hypothetical protein ACFB15_25745 [Cyclobacteriaceae bacterium]